MGSHRYQLSTFVVLLVILVLVASIFSLMGRAPEDHGDTASVDPVQATLNEAKPTVAEFGSDRCYNCKQMKIVLSRLRQSHGEHVGVVEIDVFSPEGRGLVSRYRIQMMPTQIFFDAKGQEIGRHVGPIGIDDILANLGFGANKADRG